jgi:hypothetical protein
VQEIGPGTPTTPDQVAPRKPFADLTGRGKRKRVSSLFVRTPDSEELSFLQEKNRKRRRLDMPCQEQRRKDNNTLMLFYDVDLGKSKYMAAAGRHNWPSYYQVKNARTALLYPPNISYGENRTEVALSDLIPHSCARILEFFFEENSSIVQNLTEVDKMSLELWGKVGGDGQGDHSQYCQKNEANVSGTSIYCSSYVPLQLKANGKLIWANSEPNSPLICQPLVFTFSKETDELIQVEELNLRKQIANLSDMLFTVGTEQFCLKANSVHIYSTMWDGKSCTAIAKSFLAPEKKLASNTCHLCLASPTEMRSSEVWKRPIKIPEMIDYSCTPLHMWIRSMEYLFHLAMKLPKGNSSKPLTSKDCELTKLELQVKYVRMLSLRGLCHEILIS